jgi:hypothetical protein
MTSPRESVADALVDTCIFGGLDESYGVNKNKVTDNGKTFWEITFAKARTLDGFIRVYSPNFILVKWMGARAVASGLPMKGQEVFRNEQDVKKFIVEKFVN